MRGPSPKHLSSERSPYGLVPTHHLEGKRNGRYADRDRGNSQGVH